MSKPLAVMNWSGGKDSALSLHKVLEKDEFDVRYLLTTVNKDWQRISIHGVRRELLKRQAESIGIELIEVLLPETPSMEVYEAELGKAVDFLVEKGVTHSIFGDIFLEDLREYREKQLEKRDLQGVFPIWKIPSGELIDEFIELKFKAIIVCVNANKLTADFCGRTIDRGFIGDLPADVDICGENGEFHSFVYDAPYFKTPIEFTKGEIVSRGYHTDSISTEFYFCDLLTT